MGMDYRKIWIKEHGDIPIDKFGRSYEIHHRDGNRNNNSIGNLQCISIQEHLDIHSKQGDWAACALIKARMEEELSITGWKHSEESKKKIGIASKNRSQNRSQEYRMKQSLAGKGRKLKSRDAQYKNKMSEVKRGGFWITNGSSIKYLKEYCDIPEGYVKGRKLKF